jgi:hypothetical protein
MYALNPLKALPSAEIKILWCRGIVIVSPIPFLSLSIVPREEQTTMTYLIVPQLWHLRYAPALVGLYYLAWIIYARTLHPLAKVPGPFWPSISRTWLMWHHHSGDIEIMERSLHAKYGPILRIAPDEVVVADPKYISRIYPIQKPLQKTDWYRPWRPQGFNSQPDLFTETNERHMRRIAESWEGFTRFQASQRMRQEWMTS